MMRTYRRNFFLLFFTLILISTITVATRRSSQKKQIPLAHNPVVEAQKTSIIFDLINVLFKESYVGFAKKIGYGELTSYALTHWKNPGYRCLDMLHEISKHNTQQPHLIISLNGRTMPRCIVELHEGTKTCAQAQDDIKDAITALEDNKFFTSAKEKKLMLTIMNLMLDPTVIAQVTEPIKPMVSLAEKLKRNGHSLYLCANIPEEFYAMLQNKYPNIIALFDGIIISSHIKKAKPDTALFQHLLTTHNLDPKQCIVIDNFKENVATANSIGMHGVVYEKTGGLMSYLKRQGIRV